MSEIEIASLELDQSDNNQQENSDFVNWINSFTFEENFNLNYPFDKWQTMCSLFGFLYLLYVLLF